MYGRITFSAHHPAAIPGRNRVPFSTRRATIAGAIAAFGFLWLAATLAAGGTPPYATALAIARTPALHAGMTEPDVWRTLGFAPPLIFNGSGPRTGFIMGYRLPLGYGLQLVWDRTASPCTLRSARLFSPFR